MSLRLVQGSADRAIGAVELNFFFGFLKGKGSSKWHIATVSKCASRYTINSILSIIELPCATGETWSGDGTLCRKGKKKSQSRSVDSDQRRVCKDKLTALNFSPSLEAKIDGVTAVDVAISTDIQVFLLLAVSRLFRVSNPEQKICSTVRPWEVGASCRSVAHR